MRKLGDIMHDVENLIGKEMIEQHDMQMQEVISQIIIYADTHYPNWRPIYMDDTRMQIVMGHIDEVFKEVNRLRKLNNQRKK